MTKKFIVFIHTYKVVGWESILKDQMDRIEKCGLKDNSDIYICDNTNLVDTAYDAWKFSHRNKNKFILIIENTGVTTIGTEWESVDCNYRNWILDGVINDWKNYTIELSNGYDVCADNFKEDTLFNVFCPEKYDTNNKDIYPRHFSSGHWWTTSEYLFSLKNPKTAKYFPSRLFLGDVWMCSNVEGKFKELRHNFSLEPHDKWKHRSLTGGYYF